MAFTGVQQIVVKYRNRSVDDLNQCLISLCRHLSNFSTVDKQTESIIVALRELFLMLHLSRSERRVPENVTSLFLSALADLKVIHPQLLAIALACLVETSPSTAMKINLNSLESVDTCRIPIFLRLLRLQDIPADFTYGNTVQLIRLLNDAVAESSTKKSVLSFLVLLFQNRIIAAMSQDCFDTVCWSVANWLINASTFDDSQHEKNKRSKVQSLLTVTELDGSTPSEFFTVMSLARSYAEDQFMNISSFSVLYSLVSSSTSRELMLPGDYEGPLNMQLATLKGRVRSASFQDAVMDYCLYLVKQSEVRPFKNWYDCEFQDAVISEAVRILDLICVQSPQNIRKCFRAVMDVNDRALRKIHSSPVLLQTFQFMINHGEYASFELDNMSHFLCTDLLPSAGLLDPIFASEFVALLRGNYISIQRRTKIFSRFFPSLFKILAWNPRANMHLFVDLINPLVTPTVHLEIFHSLIDLPCTSVALEVSVYGEKSFLSSVRQLASDRTGNQRLKLFFDFFLRNESGRGDLLDNVVESHRLLADVATHPRVSFATQAVPPLLSIYFTSVAAMKTEFSFKKLSFAILDRMHSLFRSFDDLSHIQEVMSDGLCLLISTEPGLFAEIHQKICDYIVANHFLFPTFLTTLIWCIGEHANETLAEKEPLVLKRLYDSVEFLTYDIIKTRSGDLISNPQGGGTRELFRTALSTMTKLGSLSYELTRRAVICLNNVIKKTKEHPESLRANIHEQTNSLIKMLALPSVREIVMHLSISPEPEVLEALELLESETNQVPDPPSSLSL